MSTNKNDFRPNGGTFPAVRTGDPVTLANRLAMELDYLSQAETDDRLHEIARACNAWDRKSTAGRIRDVIGNDSKWVVRNALSFLI